MLTHFSLFSGIGGIDLAAEWAGFQTVGQCELADYPYKVLCKHWPDVLKWRGVTDVTNKSVRAAGIKRIDLLSGGFPCQPHSVAGKHKGSADERDLWPEYRRVISETSPRWVLGENVPGLLSSDDRRFFRGILRDLAQMGYSVGWCVFGACDVGAPHRRERLFVVAYSGCSLRQGDLYAEADGITDKKRYADKTERPGEAQSDVADTDIQGPQRRGQGMESDPGRKTKALIGCYASGFNNRSTQSGLGRVPDGIPAGMDEPRWPAGFWPTPTQCGNYNRKGASKNSGNGLATAVKWPAGLGQPQYDWEPPRVATGIKNRTKRLECLGNAVVPWQVYPILKAIHDIEEAEQCQP